MRNLHLTIAYDGTAYAGWQIQSKATTVQGVLKEKIQFLFGDEIWIGGSSRTDSGVHALDQQVTIHVPDAPLIAVDDLQRALEKLLPDDIRLQTVLEAPEGFHVRHDTHGKAYTYLLHDGTLQSPFAGRYSWAIRHPLDLDAMNEAAPLLLGTHDFTTFSTTTRNNEQPDPVKTLYRFEIQRVGPFIMLTVVGTSFLYRMVRRLTGFMVAIGKGRLQPDQTAALLAAKNRNAGFETAPPQGLFLDRVFYDQEPMLAYRRTTLPFMDGLA